MMMFMQEDESKKQSVEEQASIMQERVEKLMNIEIRKEMSIRLRQTIDELPHPLNERIAGFVVKNAGKMLRPMLLVMTAKLLGAKGKILEMAKDSGIAVELLHSMTLIHDDILDGAPLRRGMSSYHRMHGIEKAIHDGDVLHAYALTLVEDPRCIRLMLDIAYQVSKGSYFELEPRFDKNFDLSEEYILNILRLKTAIVFYGCVRVSCILTGREELSEMLKEVILNAGIAFQLQDDILDIIGQKEKFGKESYWDIQESKRNLFLHYSLQEEDGEKIKDIYLKEIGKKSQEEIEFVLTTFQKPVILNRVIDLRDNFLNSCIKQLDEFINSGKNNDEPFFEYLKDLILYLCTRDK